MVARAIEGLSHRTDMEPLERKVRDEPGNQLIGLAQAVCEYGSCWEILGWNLAVAGMLARGTLGSTAELRGHVMALWQRLGDVLDLLSRQGGFQYPEDQAKIRNARALHALWKREDPTCRRSRNSR